MFPPLRHSVFGYVSSRNPTCYHSAKLIIAEICHAVSVLPLFAYSDHRRKWTRSSTPLRYIVPRIFPHRRGLQNSQNGGINDSDSIVRYHHIVRFESNSRFTRILRSSSRKRIRFLTLFFFIQQVAADYHISLHCRTFVKTEKFKYQRPLFLWYSLDIRKAPGRHELSPPHKHTIQLSSNATIFYNVAFATFLLISKTIAFNYYLLGTNF